MPLSGPSDFDISGHYEGNLTTLSGTKYARIPVRADIPSNAAFPLTLKINDMSGQSVLTLTLSNPQSSSLTLTSSLGLSQPASLVQAEGCFMSKSEPEASFCPSSGKITFETHSNDGTSSTSLSLFRLKAEPPLILETPQAYTLTQAIERARKMSFDSRIEFEHVLRARESARAAYLHLLPQITMGTIANNLTPSFGSILGSIGDLAPFLLPSRWIEAGQAKDLSRAEQDAQKLMRLDTGTQVEGLFYTFARDRVARDFYEATLSKAVAVRNEVKIREDLGQLAVGSTDNMNSTINQIEQSLSVFNQLLAEDLSALSQALGLSNPEGVLDAQIDHEEAPIEQAPSFSFDEVSQAAISRAFELDQIDDLIDSATKGKQIKYFSWLDPAGDPGLGLGFALPSQIEISQSQIRELQITRDQMKAVISKKALNAVTDYHQSLQAYRLALDGMSIQERLLDQAIINLEAGTKVDLFGLVQIFQNDLSAQIAREAAVANYRVARAQINRLLLLGYYSDF
jgi:outer membrane protein TolC